jgi:formylglycine-generating enzyme required for sulfatase activity
MAGGWPQGGASFAFPCNDIGLGPLAMCHENRSGATMHSDDEIPDQHEPPRGEGGTPEPDADTRPDSDQADGDCDDGSLGGLTENLGLDQGPASKEDPLVGRNIGGITLEHTIAEGGMGRVYRGVQDKPRRAVAVKVMRPGYVSKEVCRRFENESELLGRLRHPYIAQVYSAGMCSILGANVPYFVMEYVADALPITVFAKRHRLTMEQRLELFRKVCEAVAHGHEKGVIHRDLKPGNILVEPSGIPKVIDFGVARSVEAHPGQQATSLTEMGQLIGTVQYMSPEQFLADSAQIDKRADVYALGVILYELLTGKPPYEIRRKQIFEAAEVVRKRKPVAPSKLNATVAPDIERIAGRCLQKERSRRYPNASELAADLSRSAVNPNSVQDRPGGSASDGRADTAWQRGWNRTWTAVSAVAVIAAAGAAALLFTPGGPPPQYDNSLGMTMVQIPPGHFTIGSPLHEPTRGGNEEQQEVDITVPFLIGKHEVTQAQWKSVMGTEPWLMKDGLTPAPDAAAVCVSWNDALTFCRKLTEREQRKGALKGDIEYRLPTEAEWEVACRAGSSQRYCYGEEESILDRYAWFRGSADGKPPTAPQSVGKKLPNRWGIHDMHGNAWEWVLDAYDEQPPPGKDPLCQVTTEQRVLRGGSWRTAATELRSARRFHTSADNRFTNAGDLGFRVVLGRAFRRPPSASRPQAPVKLTAFRGSVDRRLTFEVVGHDRCPVWGSNPYSDDSCFATAAVHAGVLRAGERGMVTVTLLPGLNRYEGSVANNVQSRSWGGWPGAFQIETIGSEDPDYASSGSDALETVLADMPVKKTLVGWGTFRAGRLDDVLVNGSSPDSIIVAPASSLTVYELPDGFRGTVEGSVGLAGLARGAEATPATCRFRILGDDVVLWESSVINQDPRSGISITEHFRISLEGRRTLSLEADSLRPDRRVSSVWISPTLKGRTDSVRALPTND